jgi:hypothetical protein
MTDKAPSVEDATRLRLTAFYLCGAECDLPDGWRALDSSSYP